MRHYLLVEALFTSWRFFKMAANECGFDDLKQMEKTALTQSPKTY